MYGEKIRKVILYGSNVISKVIRDSDIDLLMLLDEPINPIEVRKSLSDFLYDILLNNNELILVITLLEYFFENNNYPFMLNVKKEVM